MRRELLPQLPALSRHFNIQPWDVDRLRYREIQAYVAEAARLDAAERVRR